MGDIKGFLKIKRHTAAYRPVCERVKDYKSVNLLHPKDKSMEQASRCMDCGTPFCHWACPLGNYIPEWNDLIYRGRWKEAYQLLDACNNMPEITGRVCPALCEYSCVLGINDEAVTIKENELAVAENALLEKINKPKPPKHRTGKKIAIVGSGPAGISCADQLNRAGHSAVVFERDDKPGGILRYGIPDFKLEKNIIDRRIKKLTAEGIKFETKTNVGVNYKASKLLNEFDAAVLTGGSRMPRDLDIPGRNLKGIHFAMDYLIQANRVAEGENIQTKQRISAKGENVVIIGGGDTGADCLGVAHRQGAKCVVQIEVMPKPAECRGKECPWPKYPLLLKSSSSHLEGGQRQWSILTREFIGEKGDVKKIKCVEVKFADKKMKEIPGSEFVIDADLVILAVGFLHPEHTGLIADLNIKLDNRGNVKTDKDYMTSKKGIFCAGDMRRGQSLVVWAISEGRCCAYAVDKYLMGSSDLPCM